MKGLINCGNTCYLNAGLQMFIQNNDFINLILKNDANNSILEILSKFLNEYISSKKKSICPITVKELVEQKNSIFVGNQQNDAGEFIIFFLDIINDELKKKNIDNELFEIHTKIKIKCKLKKCLNISTQIEKINFLLLDINDNFTTLDDCYIDYNKRIKFENDELYFCDKCNAKRIASKRIEIIHFPKHLIIYLKRFIYDGTRCFKNNKSIDIPLCWKNYNLQGIIFHSGSLYSGHYIYIGKNNNKWYMFNDNDVSEIDISRLNDYKNFGYILYYSLE